MCLPLWLALLVGCRCAEPDEAEAVLPPAPHFGDWELLLRTSWKGDLRGSARLARDLSMGPVDEEHEAAGRVGGALGFLQVAASPEELADGVARAAVGCGACHEDRGVSPRAGRPPLAHTSAADWAAWGVVWNTSLAVAEGEAGELPAPVREALTGEGTDQARLAATVVACQSCHAGGEPTGTPGSP